jgi:hypothetical protein
MQEPHQQCSGVCNVVHVATAEVTCHAGFESRRSLFKIFLQMTFFVVPVGASGGLLGSKRTAIPADDTEETPLQSGHFRNGPCRRARRHAVAEGTPPRASAFSRGHSSSDDSFFLRGFRARGFPTLPPLPGSSLNGKEGVDRKVVETMSTHTRQLDVVSLGDDYEIERPHARGPLVAQTPIQGSRQPCGMK